MFSVQTCVSAQYAMPASVAEWNEWKLIHALEPLGKVSKSYTLQPVGFSTQKVRDIKASEKN